MQRTAVFLDVDGVMLDPVRTPAEWIRLIGDVLAPALGGEPADWGRANAEAFPRVIADRTAWYDDDPATAEHSLITLLLREQCRIVGVAYPGDDAAFALGREIDLHVCRNSDSAFPATIDVIRELATTHQLHTATGNPSWRVEALLEQWGVRDLFGVTTGTDLVGVTKDTEDFYRRVFALADVPAAHAVVVDDSASQLRIAHAVGARTVLVAPERAAPDDAVGVVITNIAELPDAIRSLA